MMDEDFFVTPDRAPLRLQLTASEGLREMLGSLIKPELRQKFGEKILRGVAQEVLLDLSEHGNQFAPDQERAYSEYNRTVQGLNTRKFPLQPLVQFKQDEGHNLHIGLWLVTSPYECRKIMSPPLYGSHDNESVGVRVRLAQKDILPDTFLSAAMGDVESAIGMRHPATLAAGRAASWMYFYNLSVSRVPVIVKPYPRNGE